MTAPTLVAHADWSMHAAKRWMACAVLRPEGYLALPPGPVGALESFWTRLAAVAAPGSILIGFDFPIGLPAAYAERVGIADFLEALDGFGDDFYEVARTPEQIALRRPFYPHRPGGRSRRQLLDGLGFETWQHLHRRCDRSTQGRPAACPMFWTLGGNQVGRAAITGWRDLLAPARQGGVDVAIWPFDGPLPALLRTRRLVVAETYPGEVYGHLGLALRAHGGKRRHAARSANAARLLAWAEDSGIAVAPELAAAIATGFGGDSGADDRFDAVVGLFGLLNVLRGGRPSGEPDDPVVRRIEGWILGLDAAHISHDRSQRSRAQPEGDNARQGVL
ncbi:MAG: hypothetical protein ACREJ5_25525 [Geminicoccaceae bacterium]